jgi:hypothetical protein
MSSADEPTKANQALFIEPPEGRLKGPSTAVSASLDEPAKAVEPSLARDAASFARYYLGRAGNLARPYLGGRRGLILLATAVLGAGAALNWGWLVAIGLAPILIAVAPCAVMCALGLCAMGRGKSCSSEDPSPKSVSRAAVPPKPPEDA